MNILIIISYIVLVLTMPFLMYLEHKMMCQRFKQSIYLAQHFDMLSTPEDDIADIKNDVYKTCFRIVKDEEKRII